MKKDPVEIIPPHSLEAEQSTLGSMMMDLRACRTGLSIVQAEDFYRPAHQHIYRALATLVAQGQDIDLLTVSIELRRLELIDAVGGVAYLNSLIDLEPSSCHIESYARKVQEYSIDRRMRSILYEAYLSNGDEQPSAKLERVMAELRALSGGNTIGAVSFRQALGKHGEIYEEELELRQKNPHGVIGAYAGLPSLDRIFGGLRPGTLTIVCSPSGLGKTAFGLQCAIANARQGKHALVFSMEMTTNQLVERVITNQTSVPLSKITHCEMTLEERSEETNLGNRPMDMTIIDAPALTVAQMHAKAEQVMDDVNGLGFILIDYTQIAAPSPATKNMNRETQVKQIAVDMKAMAKCLRVPIMALSQVNELNQTRESRGIYNEADIEMLILRDTTVYAEQQQVEFAIRKYRQGGGMKVTAWWLGPHVRFVDLDQYHGE